MSRVVARQMFYNACLRCGLIHELTDYVLLLSLCIYTELIHNCVTSMYLKLC